MHTQFIRISVALLAALFCNAAAAHPGHGDTMAAGLLHPLLGWDHMTVMLLVGVWAAQLGGQAHWTVPAGFVAAMAACAGLATAYPGWPMVESGVALSVLTIGLLIALSVRVGAAAGACIVGLLAVCHGYAHGVEMPTSASPWSFGAGFVLSTVLLHALGLLLGLQLRRQKLLLSAAGLGAVIGGGWMLAGTVL